MATPEDENVYDTRGTVLYCTVPVITAAVDEPSVHNLNDALNIPLDYEMALTVLESEQAQTCTNGGTGLTNGAGLMSSGVNGATTRSAGCVLLPGAADGHLSSSGAAVAAGSLNTGGKVPAQSTQMQSQQRAGVSNVVARYSMHSGTQRSAASVSFKGEFIPGAAGSKAQRQQQLMRGSSSVGNQLKGVSRIVGLGDGVATGFGSVVARNAYVAKVASARGAVKTSQTPDKNLNTLKGTSSTATAVTAARMAGGRALTVADAMDTLFPIVQVDRSGDYSGQDTAGDDQAWDGEKSRRVSVASYVNGPGASAKGVHGGSRRNSGDTEPTQSGGNANTAALPELWRRADVTHVSRLDVVLLYLHLQRRCAEESARPRGVVCPNRERLYCDALQELTRQITLLCPERGLLLDELAHSMEQSIETYDVLLDSASQYAVRKSTERDLHQYLFAEKAQLETEVRRREHRVSEWRAKYAGMQKRLEEQQAADEKLHEQEIAYARKANTQLVNEIKRLASEAEKLKES